MDPIANMLVAIKNAGKVKKASVTVPHSKMKEAIALTP
jgi:ribosomal protein S8